MRAALVVRIACVACFVLTAARAHAHPFLEPRPVPSAIAGPTDPQVAATFYNPAALGPLRGFHAYVEGGPRFYLGSIDRTAPAGTQDRGGNTPINFTNFDGFVGLSFDLWTDTITLGVATMAPFVDLSHFGSTSPVAYAETKQQFAVWEQTVAAAIRISSRFFIGVSANFAETWLLYKYARDTAPVGGSMTVNDAGGLERPGARQDVRLHGTDRGIGFSVGILGRPIDRLWLSLSYVSHIFNTTTTDEETGARVGSNVVGSANIAYSIPDIMYAGGRLELTSRVELEASLRWVHYGARSQLDVDAQGGNLGTLATPLPPELLLDRGLQDAFGIEVSSRFRIGDNVRLSPSLMFETSAVEASAINAAALDAPKLDLALVAEWRVVKHLRLGLHVGGTAYLVGAVHSRFDANDQVRCVDSHYSLDACQSVQSGSALPSASGQYTLFVLHLGAAIGVDY